MQYVRLYRTVDFLESNLLETKKCISSVRYVKPESNNLNSFNYTERKKHFFLSVYSAGLMQKAFPNYPFLYSFDLPLDLCLPYMGAGKYNINDQDFFFLEFAIPLKQIAKCTEDYQALLPFIRNFKYYDYKLNYNILKLIKLRNKIFFQKQNITFSTGELLSQANDFYAEDIYKQSLQEGNKFKVSEQRAYVYLQNKKLIRKL